MDGSVAKGDERMRMRNGDEMVGTVMDVYS